MDNSMDGKHIAKLYEKAKGARSTWESHWQEIANVVMPAHTFTSVKTPGAKLRQSIVSSVAPLAFDQFTDALHGLLNNPAIMWFNLAATDAEVGKDRTVTDWLQNARDVEMALFNSTESGFNAGVHELYGELVVFCTGAIYRTVEQGEGVKFTSVPLSELFLLSPMTGPKRRIIRRFQLAADEAVIRFPDSETAIKRAASGGSSEKIAFIQFTAPNDKANPNDPTAAAMAFQSTYVDEQSKAIVGTGGHNRFPFYTPRWKKSPGELYGRGPGIYLLPEIKQLNKMIETIMAAGELSAFPPWAVPHDGYIGLLKMKPRSINYFRRDLGKAQAFPMSPNSQPQIAFELIGQAVATIKKGLYEDVLNLPLVDRMTTIEVFTRRQERQQILSPIVSRIAMELLGPIVKDTLLDLIDSGKIPKPPDLLGDVRDRIEVIYESPLAASQRSSIAQTIEYGLARTADLAQLKADVVDRADVDWIQGELMRLAGVPAKFQRRDVEVATIRSNRADAQVAQAALELAQGAQGNG